MADVKYSQMPVLPSPVVDTDLHCVVRNGVTYQAPSSLFRAGLLANSNRYQKNNLNVVAGTVFYDVVFNPPLISAPSKAVAHPVLATANGELIPAAFHRGSLTANGGRIYLASVPTANQTDGLTWEVEV